MKMLIKFTTLYQKQTGKSPKR